MSWMSLIKPPGRDPKNINEWLGLITDQLRELKQTENWYDVSRVVTSTSVVDNLESHSPEQILSANQGRILKELVDTLETNINDLISNIESDIEGINTSLEENIAKIEQNITDISNLESSLNVLSERINKNNDDINDKLEIVDSEIDKLQSVNNIIIGSNKILSGLEVNIVENVITTSIGNALLNNNLINVDTELTITVTDELLNTDSILLLVLKVDEELETPVLDLVTTLSDNEVLLSKLYIIGGKIDENLNIEPSDSMNNIIGISADNEADTIRTTIPSGFITLGELDFEYMENNENQIKLKSESIAYIYGYKVVIPANTIINVSRAPEKESREDLIFLEGWKDIDFPKTGKLRWRIRCVNNVDFNTYYMDGFSAGLNGRNRQVTARGSNLVEYTPSHDTDAIGSFNRGDLLGFKDQGLYVTSCNKELFKTLDGYVYAIPMFRLYRKPSCGKCIPFEYSKFNPKCDYNKFSKLIKEDKVERVVNENIKGRSLVNYANPESLKLQNNSFNIITSDGIIKSNKEYTIYLKSSIISGDMSNKKLRLVIRPVGNTTASNDINFDISSVQTQNEIVKFKIPSQTIDILRLYIHLKNGISGDEISITDIMILEGDWTNKEIPEFFTGMKSLGEDDNNLITIKNGILDNDAYNPDINDIQKLNVFDDVTYLSCDSRIQPSMVEANIKNGDTITPVTSLNCKLDTQVSGELEFIKICGRTCHNLITEITNNIVQHTPICKSHLLKPNTNYTLFVNNKSNNTYNSYLNEFIFESQSFYITKGVNKIIVRTLSTMEDTGIVLKNHAGNTNFELDNILLLEGIYETDNEPYIEGIKSVDNIIKLSTIGKNLISKEMYTNTWFTSQNSEYNIDRNDNSGKKYSIYGIKTFGISHLKLTCNKEFNRLVYRGKDKNNNIIYCGDLGSILKTDHVFDFIPSQVVTMDLYVDSRGIDDRFEFMLKEIDDNDSCIPHKCHKQNIYLKEPLMSLPDGTCDELVGNKIIRRVGKFILDEKLDWKANSEVNETKTCRFILNGSKLNVGNNKYICDKFIARHSSIHGDYEYIMIQENGAIFLNIFRNRLEGSTQDSLKSWIKDNNVTVYYALETPVEEYLYHIYDKESIKTYQMDAPLRGFTNGTKDEIKDGILIRRCGEIILDGSDDEGWVYENENSNRTNTTLCKKSIPSFIKERSSIICDKFKVDSDVYYNDMEGIYLYNNTSGMKLSISRSKLNSNTLVDFKQYLQANPIKVIYELSYPIEIPLIETNSQSVDYSLNRQFKEGNYLRELPNGIKDTIENGKVIRRIGKKIYNGNSNEGWNTTSDLEYDDCKRFDISISDIKAGETSCVICDRFEYRYIHYSLSNSSERNKEGISQHSKELKIGITISKSRLSDNTVEGFKSWLSQNSITIYYELSSPIEEELTNKNCNYYPSHDFNTYCGNMYIGDGRNYIINENKMSTEDSIIIGTEFREIENSSLIEDCRYKKSDYGYDNMYDKCQGKNLVLLKNLRHYSLTEASGNLWIQSELIEYDSEGNIIWYNNDDYEWSDMGVILNVKSNTKYTFSMNIIDNKGSSYNLVVAEFSKKPIIDVGEANVPNYLKVKKLGTSTATGLKTFTFTTHKDAKYVYCMLSIQRRNETYTLNNFMVNEGDPIDFEMGISDYVSFENIEESEIDDLRHQVSLSGFNYPEILDRNFEALLKGGL